MLSVPSTAAEGITGSVTWFDVQAVMYLVYLRIPTVGAKILRQYGIGPLPGVAMMVVPLPGAGSTVTVRYDRASVRTSCSLNACRRVSTKPCAGARWSGTACAAGVVRYS